MPSLREILADLARRALGDPNSRPLRPAAIPQVLKKLSKGDSFFSSNVPLIKDLPQTGVVASVRQLLQQLNKVFGGSSTNASPTFRFALHDWALGVLVQCATLLQGFLSNADVKQTPEGKAAVALEALVHALIGSIKTFNSFWLEVIKQVKNLGKLFQELMKPG